MKGFIQKHRKSIEIQLLNFLSSRKREYSITAGWSKDIFSYYEFTLRGKLFRGGLLLYAYQSYKGKIKDEAVKAAAALELFQSAILIHDDVIDRDEKRRGRDSIPLRYHKIAIKRRLSEPARFGQSMAICLGDIGIFLTLDLLSSMKLSVTKLREIWQLFLREFTLVGLGEMQDIYLGSLKVKDAVKNEELLDMYLLKTAGYTFSLPFKAGLILAGGNKNDMETLDKIGKNIGLIYQIKDDELGIFGNREKTGKGTGTDLTEGKKTLYYNYLYARADDKTKRILDKLKIRKKITEEVLKYIQEKITDLGIKNTIDRFLREKHHQAVNLIDLLHISTPNKKELKDFVSFLLNREK